MSFPKPSLRSLALLSLLFLTAFPLRAAAPPTLTPDQILKELDVLENKHRAAQEGSLNDLMNELGGAENSAAAALSLFQKAVFEVEFNGEKGDHAEFQKWQKKNDATFHDPLFAKALSLHLKYIELSLDYAKSGDAATLTDPLLAYLEDLWDYLGKIDKEDALTHDLTRKSIADGAVAKFYQVDSLLGALKKWELVPANDAGILKTTILPALRDAKSPKLVDVWDEWIAHGSDNADQNPLADQKEKFQSDTLPNMRWDRANDLLLLGKNDQAMSEMLEIIKAYPLHANNANWIAQLRDLLQPKDKPKTP